MKFLTITGVLTILTFGSCAQHVPKNKGLNTQKVKFKTELKIENKKNRGTSYTDSKGTNYNLRYIPISVTNTDSVPIRIQFDFYDEYIFSKKNNNDSIKVLILPDVFALDGITLTTPNQVLIDSMQIELRKYLENGLDYPYQLNKILQPNENILLAIGSHYRANQSTPTPIPNELFIQNDISNYKECDKMHSSESTNSSNLRLWLKLNFNQGRPNENCMIIPCGQVSYLSE